MLVEKRSMHLVCPLQLDQIWLLHLDIMGYILFEKYPMRTLQKLVAFLFCVSFFSCQKEDSDDQTNPGSCKVVKMYLYDFGQLADSLFNTYTNEKITKVTLGNYYDISLTYDGSKIVRRDYIDLSTNTPDGYAIISYNTDGTIYKIDEYE